MPWAMPPIVMPRNDLRTDHRAAVVAEEVAPDVGSAEIRIDRHQHEWNSKAKHGYICTRPSAVKQLAAGRHLHHVSEGKPWLGANRQAMEITMGDGHALGPTAPMLWRRAIEHGASGIDRTLQWKV
jgi:hypothetical protein